MRRDLAYNILLSGGSSKFEGFRDRVFKEIKLLAHTGSEARVLAWDEKRRHLTNWIGGSTMGSMESMKGRYVTDIDYQEKGTANVIRRFE